MAKKYTGVDTLSALMTIVKSDINSKISELGIANMLKTENIVRDLNSYVVGETDDNMIIAAKVVKDLKATVDDIVANGSINSDDVLDTWDGYSETDAQKLVSAALIKAIKDEVDDIATTINAEINKQKGQANGLASLDDTGKVPADQLPSYVDDVVEGFLTNTGTEEAPVLVLYEPDEAGTAASTNAIVGEKGKIYVDLTTNQSYRWSGSTYVKVPGSEDMVEITAEEIETMWNEAMVENGLA